MCIVWNQPKRVWRHVMCLIQLFRIVGLLQLLCSLHSLFNYIEFWKNRCLIQFFFFLSNMLGINCMLNQMGPIVDCCCIKLADVKIRPVCSFIQESRLIRSLFYSHSNLIDSTFYFDDYCSIIFFLLFILLILRRHFSSTCGSIDVHIERIPDCVLCKISRSGHR